MNNPPIEGESETEETQALFARLLQLENELKLTHNQAAVMKRLVAAYGEKGISNNALERLDSMLLQLNDTRNAIRATFTRKAGEE